MDKKIDQEMEVKDKGEEKGKERKLSKAELLKRERREVGRVLMNFLRGKERKRMREERKKKRIVRRVIRW